MTNHHGFTVWLTGMLGAGKTTLAHYVAARLRQVGRNVEILDEDELADDFWKELGGSTKEERITISRRLAVIADLLIRNNACVLVACASPYKNIREENRRRIQRYIEVYVDCPTDYLIKQDTTGKYKKALSGEIQNFVGITDPYEPPMAPEVTVRANIETVEESGSKVFQSLLDLTYITPEEVKIITGTKMKARPKPQPSKGKRKSTRASSRKQITRSKRSAKASKRTSKAKKNKIRKKGKS